MPLSVFEDKASKPDDSAIDEVLGDTGALWKCLKDFTGSNYAATEEWKFYGKSSGWTLLLKQKKRTILYLFPGQAYFTVLFVFGEKAVQQAYENDLPGYIIERIEKAAPHMEGRSFQIEVRSEQDLEYIKNLVVIKMNN